MDRVAQIKKFLMANPSDSFLRHALALEYIKAGDDGAARRLFEDLLGDEPLYTGSYYHLGKLLERNADPAAAISWYEKGMEAARATGDQHALSELRAAWEDLAL